jgi:hypothetical protein
MKFLIQFIPSEIIEIISEFLIEKENYNKVVQSINLLPEFNSLHHLLGTSYDFSFYRQKYKYSIAFCDNTCFNYKQMINMAISRNNKRAESKDYCWFCNKELKEINT